MHHSHNTLYCQSKTIEEHLVSISITIWLSLCGVKLYKRMILSLKFWTTYHNIFHFVWIVNFIINIDFHFYFIRHIKIFIFKSILYNIYCITYSIIVDMIILKNVRKSSVVAIAEKNQSTIIGPFGPVVCQDIKTKLSFDVPEEWRNKKK